MAKSEESMLQVFVVSDGTGETAAAAVRAAMAQFQSRWRMRIFAEVRREQDARRVIPQAAEAGALVVFSLVDKRTAETLLQEAQQAGVATVDLLGPLISKVAQHLRAEPRHEPGLLHGFSDDYFERVEAVEFAVQHDDGANVHTLFQADIVLTGVSRTSKTPLTMYLAQRGYKTGNVPLVPGMEPPRPLLEIDPKKVFGLMIDQGTLLRVRHERLVALGQSPHSHYTDDQEVRAELAQARRLFRQQGWRSIDITNRAVEENASRLLEMLH
jgi:regulator of PEP synthase PpsR (kinase-PPPase family)